MAHTVPGFCAGSGEAPGAEVKNKWTYTFALHHASLACTGTTLPTGLQPMARVSRAARG